MDQNTSLEQFSVEFEMLSNVENACPNENYVIMESKLLDCYENAFRILKSVNYENKLYKNMISNRNDAIL